MPFIETTAPADAQGAVREMYQRQQDYWGYVPNYAKLFSHRPEVLARWGRLLAEIRRPMDDRRFELVTFVAALELKNTACSLEHGRRLAEFVGRESVQGLASGTRLGALTQKEAIIAAFVRKVARDAAAVTANDVQHLREQGLSDAEIFDIVAAAAGRSFFTKILDSLGALADSPASGADRSFGKFLMVGRPVSTDRPESLENIESTPGHRA